VYFLTRHGRGHRILPSELNHRANIYAFKVLAVDAVLSVTAVGSLREALRPGDLLLPDQYFDRTRRPTEHTFFGEGVVAHVGLADPVCPSLRTHLHHSAEAVCKASGSGAAVHKGGTYVNMEGPAFSTRAESESYRAAGFDVIGMTSLPEAKLAREAELCYAAMALVTDYDCWRISETPVSAEEVLATVQANADLARQVIERTVLHWPEDRPCSCRQALDGAVMTDLSVAPASTLERLKPILARALGESV
jgi:5'-methylthioadenosine phosphorylase